MLCYCCAIAIPNPVQPLAAPSPAFPRSDALRSTPTQPLILASPSLMLSPPPDSVIYKMKNFLDGAIYPRRIQ
jgi:hypothetical protein